MTRIRCLLMSCLIPFLAINAAAEDEPAAKVMLMGTFHFSDPGLDAVKTRSLDVTNDASQRYLETLSLRIAEQFRPTRVLLEYAPDRDAEMNERYRRFLAGEFELGVNEVYQLGFRIARASGLDRVSSFDEREIEWQAEPMLAYAEAHDPAAHAAFEQRIAEITERMQREQDTLSLPALLAQNNNPENHAANKALYIETNDIAAGDGYFGADAAASWWHRNFRMYANIQKAAQPGERVFVLAGSGHIAIIADLLALDGERIAVDVRPLLREE